MSEPSLQAQQDFAEWTMRYSLDKPETYVTLRSKRWRYFGTLPNLPLLVGLVLGSRFEPWAGRFFS